jgi:DNA-binding transcriptional MerR regulator
LLIRRYQENGFSLDKAIKTAIEQCIKETVLMDFLQENYEEVANMLLREYRIEDELEARMEEGEEKGIIDSARKFLASGMSLNRIVEILELSNDHIKQLEGSAV